MLPHKSAIAELFKKNNDTCKLSSITPLKTNTFAKTAGRDEWFFSSIVDDGFTTLVSEAEEKYVSFRLDGLQVVVRTGKQGIKGYTQVKNFESVEERWKG